MAKVLVGKCKCGQIMKLFREVRGKKQTLTTEGCLLWINEWRNIRIWLPNSDHKHWIDPKYIKGEGTLAGFGGHTNSKYFLSWGIFSKLILPSSIKFKTICCTSCNKDKRISSLVRMIE